MQHQKTLPWFDPMSARIAAWDAVAIILLTGGRFMNGTQNSHEHGAPARVFNLKIPSLALRAGGYHHLPGHLGAD
jgi:hypothetical protein